MKPLKNKPADNIMEELRLISGGRLLSTKWDGDSKRYVTTDVTPSAPCYLFEACELDAGVILRDIFLLLQQHIDFYQNAIGNHVTEFVAEGLQQQQTKPEDSGLSYLELSWKLEYSPKEKRLWGNLRPRFCGFAPDGEKCGLSGSYANELALLPVRLNHQFPIVVQQKKTPELQDFNGAEFSLGQILEGIIWELSYFGGPQGRKEFESLIAETISEIKTREENTASKNAVSPKAGAKKQRKPSAVQASATTCNLPPAIAAIPDRPIPDWLARLNLATIKTCKLPLRQILEESCFYPASGQDGHPIRYFARNCLSFVYADYGVSKSQFKMSFNQQETKIRGYSAIGMREVTKELDADDWWVAAGQKSYVGLSKKVFLAPAPYAFWVVVERQQGYGKNHGPERFSLLYLCQDGVAAFQRLYLQHSITPKFLAIIQPGSGFGGNWTRFEDSDSPLAQSVLSNPAGVPEYMLHGYGTMHSRVPTACWPQFADNLGYLCIGNKSWIGVWQRGSVSSLDRKGQAQ